MKRREFILAGAAAAAWPLAARAQQPAIPVIGFLRSAPLASFAYLVTAFRQGLKETSFVESQNVAIEFRSAEGQNDRLPALAADLIRRPVANIFGDNSSAIAAKAAVITIQLLQARDGRGQQPIQLAFNAKEVSALAALNHHIEAKSKRLKNPHPSDSLAWAAWIIGRLGGWDGYPSSKPPGPITMKYGLEYFHAVAVGWSLKNVCMP